MYKVPFFNPFIFPVRCKPSVDSFLLQDANSAIVTKAIIDFFIGFLDFAAK
jgi:hypothetical protein